MDQARNLSAWLNRLAWLAVAVWSAHYLLGIGGLFLVHPDWLFGDARLYYQATATWVAGGDPWAVSRGGIAFAGIPPTLLLNLPFLPFGEDAAWIFWPVAGMVGMAVALRRLRLPLWWLAWPPFMEGWFPGSPDMALFALAILGGGAVVAVTKPYSVPWMLGDGRWRALTIGAIIAVVTIPILPWGMFIADLPAIATTLSDQARHLSAWGTPILMVPTVAALLWLRRPGLSLVTPGLWPSSQLHYAAFSLETAARTPILALGLAIPIPGVAPLSIVAYALWVRFRDVRSRRLEGVPGSLKLT